MNSSSHVRVNADYEIQQWWGRNRQGNLATNEKPFLTESRFQDLETVTIPSRGDSPYLGLVVD